jgi:hypothetical protein
MLLTHALELPEFPQETEDTPPEPAPRPAVAGGSNRRPPDDGDGSATIIPFPQEPHRRGRGAPPPAPREDLRPWPEEQPSPGASTPSDAAAQTRDEPLWPYWMAHVLTRYRGPDGSSGGAGVFI